MRRHELTEAQYEATRPPLRRERQAGRSVGRASEDPQRLVLEAPHRRALMHHVPERRMNEVRPNERPVDVEIAGCHGGGVMTRGLGRVKRAVSQRRSSESFATEDSRWASSAV